MKVCSLCKNSYEDWVEFCFADGHPLGAQSAELPSAAPPPPAPPPPTASVASAPSLDPGVPDWDAFDAPEPTLIRMQRLAAQQGGAPPAAVPRVMQPAVGGLVAPAPPSRPSASDAPDPIAPGIAAQRAQAAPEALPTPRPVPPPRHGVAAVPLESVEALPASTAEVLKAEAGRGAGPDDDFFTPRPRESEDDKATVPMYAAQPEPEDPPARAPRSRDDRDDERSMAAPAAAGIGLAMIAAIGLGAVVLLGGGFFLWKMSQAPGEPTGATTVKPPQPPPPAVVQPPPPVAEPVEPPPVEPVEPEPLEPEPTTVDAPAPTVAPPVAPAPSPAGAAGTKPPATASTTPATPTKPPATTGSKAPGTTPSTPASSGSPWGAVSTAPAPAAAASTSSDNPWGATTQQSSGTLRITSEPPGASVYVDDKSYGTTPASVDLPHGKHRVRLSLTGYRTESSDVNLNVGSMSVPFRLTPEEITGIINVFGPTGASVWIDDRDMGPLPVSVQVREGVHALKLIQADGKSCASSRDVRFTSGGRPLAINLQPCG